MAKRLYLLIFLLVSLHFFGQQKVSQPDLKAEYSLPKDWTVQQYFKGAWDKPGGSSICHCAMSFNTLKIPIGDDFDYVYMVVYPSDKKGVSDPQRSSVWQYKITHGENGDSLKTPNLHWKHYTGKINYPGEHRFKDFIAWTYETHKEKVHYTVHFWAKPTVMSQYKAVIEKIMASFKAL